MVTRTAARTTRCSTMTMTAALQRLLTFLSPAFPVGAFAWSAGLETAIAEGAVTDSTHVQNWIAGSLAHGGLKSDAIFLAHAHRASGQADDLASLADLCLALTPSAERHGGNHPDRRVPSP